MRQALPYPSGSALDLALNNKALQITSPTATTGQALTQINFHLSSSIYPSFCDAL
jgi:hypothetical protein